MNAKRATFFITVGLLSIISFSTYASTKDIEINSKIYEFYDDSHYEISKGSVSSTSTQVGSLIIQGDIIEDSAVDNFKSFNVNSGTVSVSFLVDNYQDDDTTDAEAEDIIVYLWNDKVKNIDDIQLDSYVGYAAFVIQTSLDGKRWITDTVKTNICDNRSAFNYEYRPKDIQLINGCYYRMILVYKERVEYNLKASGLFNDHYMVRAAEVYEFYLHSKEKVNQKASANNKQAIGQKYRVENNSGFAKILDLNQKDPHFGWNLGTFYVSGFTRSVVINKEKPVFLKNVGDESILWFNLEQDINRLNGKPSLSISEDKDGWDKELEVSKTDFKHGALIIRKTDYQGIRQKPIIYTDFLAANAVVGADTKVVLFEEGDYEVALDYQIKNVPRKIGGLEIIPEFSDYKIAFSFSVRNGNCMIYPFDIATKNELANNAGTKNGFKLDMAKSRYLRIDVKRDVLNTKTHAFDTRFNRPATDGEEYSDPGMYTFTVKNEYTGESTTKVIFVGDDEEVAAMKEAVK